MTRRHLRFECEGETLAASLDDAHGTTGLLWVNGGNELRAGAFSGQAQLAARVAEAGYPVFRFDRRGIGDSEGTNRGFRHSGPDIAAALSAFRANAPHIHRVVGFGNCDAASALMIGQGYGCDALILANPWTLDEDKAADLPPNAIRARYRAKLKDPAEWVRLARGGVSLTKLAKGLARAASASESHSSLARDIAEGLSAFQGSATILVAERDRTAQAFLSCWPADDTRIRRCADASHAFVEASARAWLLDQLLAGLANEEARQLDMG